MKAQATDSERCFGAFFRGLPIAALSAAGVMAVSRGHLWGVFLTSYGINLWWASNVRAVQANIPRQPFAIGAACGSVLTVWLLR